MEKNKLIFGKINYILMLAGILTLILGFFIMSADKEQYGLGSLGVTIGPIIVLLGFIVEIVAILYKPKKK